MKDERNRNNVIHVAFGRDGTHRVLPQQEVAAEESPEHPDDPLADLYDPNEVARFFGVPVKRLRTWEKKGLCSPSVERGSRRFYTFRDLVGMRAMKGLLDSGIPEKKVQRAVEGLRRTLPKVARPLNELRVMADGASLVVVDEHGSFEPTTGQQVLDFSVDRLREDVVRVLRRPLDAASRRSAYEHYLEGCRYDEDPQTMDRAADAYLAALRLDPALSCAITNLGNLRYRQKRLDEAERLYRSAVAIDSEQPEAHYNLGFLELERDRPLVAMPHLERAVELDPGFADAHFNLASAYEAIGRIADAKRHYRQYLELDETGAWADAARERLS